MHRSFPRLALSALLAASAVSISTSASAQVVDNFQSYTVGQLPGGPWKDVATILPGTMYRVPPLPSGYVINTLDAHGNPTKAVTSVGNLGDAKGIFASVPISNHYSLRADVRVDRYSDLPQTAPGDWAMQLSFGETGVNAWNVTPQVGIYASSLTKGWRLFDYTLSSNADIDLGALALPGVWYTVAQSIDISNGLFHSQIWDGATGTSLVDRFDTIAGWDPAFAKFDAFAFYAGEISTDDTIGDIGVVDNINITATTTPEPASLVLIASGLLAFGGVAARRRKTA